MKLEGEVAELDLIESLVELGREYFTGAIRFENDGVIKILYLKGGDILSASTNDRADSVDEILLRASKVTREHVKQALAKRKENETLGDALLNLGFITRKELTWARRVQAVGVIRSILQWQAGSFTMVADYLPKREEGTLFPLRQIVIEVIVTDQERARYERALESGTAVFEKASDFDQEFARLGLNEDADAITMQIDGNRTAAEIAAATGRDDFNVYKLLHALAAIGLLHRNSGRVIAVTETDPPTVALEEPVPAEDAWTEPEMSAFQFEDAAPEPFLPDAVAADLEPEPEEAGVRPSFFEGEGSEGVRPSLFGSEDPAAFETPESATPPALENVSDSLTPSFPPPQDAPPAGGWGFDAAQVETVERSRAAGFGSGASRPRPTWGELPARKQRSHVGLIVALILVAAAAVVGWMWWIGRDAPAPAEKVASASAAPIPTASSATSENQSASTPAASQPVPSPSLEATSPAATATMNIPAPAVTPAAAAASSRTVPADAAGERYEAMAREFAKTASGNFTIQFELVCRAASIEKAIKAGGAKVWFIPTAYRGQTCYRVFWGRYDTREAAAGAATEIPATIRGTRPVVVAVPKS